MSITLAIIALAGGFLVLVVTGDLLVRGSTKLARRANVPPLLVGLTIVAMGTSAPELLVSVQGVLNDAPRLAIANVVGSNIANVLLVLGLPALIAPIAAGTPGMRRNAVFGVVATAVLIIFALVLHAPVPADIPMERSNTPDIGVLDWRHGAVLLAGLVAYLGYLGIRARAGADDPDLAELIDIDDMEGLPKSWARIWAFIIIGVIGLPVGSSLIVNGGVTIAEHMNVPNAFIGLTAIALGTSLPELAATVAAALRRQTELAIGNVLGSNLFNILAVAGATTLVGPIPIPATFNYDFTVMAIAAIALLGFTMMKRPISRLMGLGFLVAYVGYVLALARIDGII